MKLLVTALLLLSFSSFAETEKTEEQKRYPASISKEKDEYQQVRGHIRSNGTYVAPYIRTSPNGTTYDNIRPRPKK